LTEKQGASDERRHLYKGAGRIWEGQEEKIEGKVEGKGNKRGREGEGGGMGRIV